MSLAKESYEYWVKPKDWEDLNLAAVQTPCYLVDERLLENNLKILDSVQKKTGCKVIMALKGFAMWQTFPLIRRYLPGVAASSLHEAKLGYEEFRKEVHVFSAAYGDEDFTRLLQYCSHIVFNSFSQWNRFKAQASNYTDYGISFGLRINPEHREVETELYDPCAPVSRLGITRANFDPDNLEGIEGLHFHNLCELNADSLARTLPVFEDKFGEFLGRMKWVNFGGGHHITRGDYDVDLLCDLINGFRKRYPRLEVYLEPGEAISLNAGVLVASVLDIIHNQMDIAILDTSAAAHMPDVMEIPYRPVVIGSGMPQEFAHTYRFGGPTCLSGDIIGDYSFPEPLQIGQKIVFLNMAHYTMVKNNTFNGVRLPSIAIRNFDGDIKVVRKFCYEDYKNRLS